MTAFDQAWDLAKMPIVPGSIERVDASDGGCLNIFCRMSIKILRQPMNIR